ncbi:MAG: cytochrome C oxidase subunit II [Myxococcota bacterium]
MLELFMQPASTFAGDVDFLVNLVAVLTFFWGGLSAAVFFWLIWRFRYREGVRAQYVTGNEPDLKRFITYPHYLIIVCDLAIIAFAVQTWYKIKQDMPEPENEVRIVAQQWAWSFVDPGADGKLGTDDDIKTVDDLHVEVDKVTKYTLVSRDVLHDFSVPVFRLKQDAIPGREITGWFEPTVVGDFDIQCAEMCGIGHGIMGARIHVETAEQHKAWIESMSKVATN